MINCLCVKNTWRDLHETKAVWKKYLIYYFIYALRHRTSKVKSWNCNIYEISDLITKNKRGCILWMVGNFVDNIWPTFCFHRLLQCRSGVMFLSLTTSVWSYLYRNGDGVYLGHNTCWGVVLGFTPYTHRSCMKFQGHKYVVNHGQIYYICLTNLNAERLMKGWTDGDYTIWPRAKMEHCRWIQYCISIQQWIAQKIGTKYWNR